MDSLCIFCIRRRRRTTTPLPARPPAKVKKPALRRAEAREKLNEVTKVSSRASSAAEDEATPRSESQSVLERECAICLSALYAPTPPEPAKLSPDEPPTSAATATATETAAPQPQSTDLGPTITRTTTAPESETILRLIVCNHEFHAECLVSWFVLRKTSCPICRSLYMSKEDMDQYDEEERIAMGGAPLETTASGAQDVEAQTPQAPLPQQSPRLPTWRYLLYGRDAYQWARERRAREQAEAQAREQIARQQGVEMVDRNGIAATTTITTTITPTTTHAAATGPADTPENTQQQPQESATTPEPASTQTQTTQPAQQPARSIWRRYFTTG
ncbi:hypothetical protein ACJQWK_00204 [Exserohilum turcicum]